MNRFRGIIAVVVAVALVVGAVAVVEIAWGDDVSATAFSVNGHRVSQSELDDELDSIASSGQLDPTAQQTAGSVTSDVGAGWITRRVQTQLILDELQRRGLEVTDADRARLRKSSGNQLAGLSDGVQRALLDYNLGLQVLQDELGENGVAPAINRAARRASVYVDPRYGRWSPRRVVVCAPTGCPSTSAGG
jgi:hypothetical protein